MGLKLQLVKVGLIFIDLYILLYIPLDSLCISPLGTNKALLIK